jgi:hypothetical protein
MLVAFVRVKSSTSVVCVCDSRAYARATQTFGRRRFVPPSRAHAPPSPPPRARRRFCVCLLCYSSALRRRRCVCLFLTMRSRFDQRSRRGPRRGETPAGGGGWDRPRIAAPAAPPPSARPPALMFFFVRFVFWSLVGIEGREKKRRAARKKTTRDHGHTGTREKGVGGRGGVLLLSRTGKGEAAAARSRVPTPFLSPVRFF